MKIKLAIFIGSLFFLGCTSTHKLKVEDFFVENNQTYAGGFENANYRIDSNIIELDGKKFLVENTIDTATTVQRVYYLNNEEILLLFTGEAQVADLSTLDINSGEIVLKDREMLSDNGIMIISATLNKKTKEIIAGPEILTRGFIYVKDYPDLRAYRTYGESKFTQVFIPELVQKYYAQTPFEYLAVRK